jgi:cation:H+ antiporter
MLDFIFYFFIFLVSILFLYLSSEWLVKSLTEIAQFLGWREFVFALFVMAFIGSLPNLFIGINSVIRGEPILSLGEVFGGNIVDLTLAIGLAALVSINGLRIESKTVQGTAIFTLIIAILPVLLIHDNKLGRVDGIVLLLAFTAYVFWLFSKGGRFTRIYEKKAKKLKLKDIFKDLCIMFGALILLFLAAEGIVRSSIFFAKGFNLPVVLIGILVVGFTNALPEIFFSIQAAKKDDDWMVIGSLMGAVISASTLVLGIIAILHPIEICPYVEAPLLTIARFFLIIAALFFFYLFFIKSSRKITKNEGLALIIVYVIFVIVQVLIV